MDQCVNVERELEKVLQNFSSYGQHCDKVLQELVDYTSGLKDEIVQAGGKFFDAVFGETFFFT